MTSPKPDEEEIFHVARTMEDITIRSKYLDQVCVGDQALRQRVEALLMVHEHEGEFLKPTPEPAVTVDRPTLTERAGDTIGRYKLLQKLGEGGFGVVYMADQIEPVKRRVALKIIKPGMDTKEVVARFEAERQALAMMDHPNIAKVLDVGTTDSGQPYFVMELVKGIPITQFCDENHLTPRQRLELFVLVCQAIQHAHQKGIIHRDIKPSNVLVASYDDRPVPKVIDFGVAKATQQQLTEKTMFTQFGQILGTVDYMSPEQAKLNQLDIDTRSDIYSLGVLLYELLVGETPFDRRRLRSAAFDELLRIIREEEPPKPSFRLTASERLSTIAANRHIEPNKLSTLVRGELDWIVMKALEKDRIRRYETANDFAADVQRYLKDEPVRACPPSTAYRLRKIIRRHKGPVIAASLMLLILLMSITGLTYGLIQARESERRAERAQTVAERERAKAWASYMKAREAIKKMVTQVAEEHLSFIPELKDVRCRLLENAITFYDELLKLQPDDSIAYFERFRVHVALWRRAEASRDLQKAVELDPRNTEFHLWGVWFYLWNDDKNLALPHAQKAVELAPYDPESHTSLAAVYRIRHDFEKAIVEYDKAIQLDSKAGIIYWDRSKLYLAMGKAQLALADARKSIELEPDDSMWWRGLAHICSSLGRYEEALTAVNRGIELTASNDWKTYRIYEIRGEILAATGKHKAALSDYNKAIALAPDAWTVYKDRARP